MLDSHVTYSTMTIEEMVFLDASVECVIEYSTYFTIVRDRFMAQY